MKSFVLAALSCTLSSAHVRMRYTDFAIRNAGTANADGKFSTAGPCGGAKTFGSNGETAVNEGDVVELNIAYNGGHKSATKNFFSVAYVCGEIDAFPRVFENSAVKDNAATTKDFTDAKGVLLAKGDIISPADDYPVDATDSLTSGYKIKFTVPKPMDGAQGEKCTFSLVEYRNWGGCVDLVITARDPNAPTPPPPPPKSLEYPTKVSLAQTYDITDLDYKMTLQTANKCPVMSADCDCDKAIEDKSCLWQKNKAATPPGPCLQCKIKDMDGCLCDVGGDLSLVRHYGTCVRDSPNCLCMDGLIKIWHQTSATTGTAELNTQVINPDNPDQVWAMSRKVALSQEGRALSTSEPVTIELTSDGQTLSQQMIIKSTPAANGDVYVSLSVVDENPTICSFEATMKQDSKEVARQDASDPPNADPVKRSDRAATVAAGWVAFIVAGILQSLC